MYVCVRSRRFHCERFASVRNAARRVYAKESGAKCEMRFSVHTHTHIDTVWTNLIIFQSNYTEGERDREIHVTTTRRSSRRSVVANKCAGLTKLQRDFRRIAAGFADVVFKVQRRTRLKEIHIRDICILAREKRASERSHTRRVAPPQISSF